MASRKLIGLHYSPWTEKARWALDFHGVPYRYVEHVPMLGEALLRARTGRLTGRVSVPLLIDGRTVVGESLQIARYADTLGSGATLFPRDRVADIDAWDARVDEAISELRFRVIERVVASRELQRAEVAAVFPAAVSGVLAPVARVGAQFIARKYADRRPPPGTLRRFLEGARRALEGKSDYLLGSLTYADLAVAVVLQGVEPVDARYMKTAPGTREAWTDGALAEEFSDLIAWRNRIYERHRR